MTRSIVNSRILIALLLIILACVSILVFRFILLIFDSFVITRPENKIKLSLFYFRLGLNLLTLFLVWVIYLTGDRSGDELVCVVYMHHGEVDRFIVSTSSRWPAPAIVFYGNDADAILKAYACSPFVTLLNYPIVDPADANFINSIEFYYLVLEGGYDVWRRVFS